VSRDTGVEVSENATALLEREGKRLLISANNRDGLDFDLACALCRDKGGVLHFGSGTGFASVRDCPLCSSADQSRETSK
jgi:hypothetical protein